MDISLLGNVARWNPAGDALASPIDNSNAGFRIEPYSVRKHGAKQDGRAAYDATISNGSSIINSATISFTSSDAGKLIAIGNRTEDRKFWKFGTILQVNSATQCVASFTGVQTLSAATLIVGSDDTTAFTNALTAASLGGGGGVYVDAMMCVRGAFTIPNGVWLEGSGSIKPPNGLQGVFYAGPTVVRMDAVVAASFLTLGTVEATHGRSASLYGLTIEGLDMYIPVAMSGYGANLDDVCVLGSSTVFNGGPSGVVVNSYFVGNVGTAANAGLFHVVGDMRVMNNQIYGVGGGESVVQIDGNGALFTNNHIYAGASTYSAHESGIKITTGGARGGNNIISNNMIDSPYGPAILLDVAGTSILSNVQVIGNSAYQNSLVPANTHPFLALVSAVGAEIRAGSINGNVGRSAWDNETLGTWTYMCDVSGVAGTTTGVSIANNVVSDVVTGLYSGGATPSGVTSSSNVIVTTAGAAVVG